MCVDEEIIDDLTEGVILDDLKIDYYCMIHTFTELHCWMLQMMDHL